MVCQPLCRQGAGQFHPPCPGVGEEPYDEGVECVGRLLGPEHPGPGVYRVFQEAVVGAAGGEEFVEELQELFLKFLLVLRLSYDLPVEG